MKVFNIFWVFINLSWILGGNCFIFRKYILIFNIWLDVYTWFITLYMLCYQTYRTNGSVLQLILWCRRIRYYWNIFYWWRRYSTMDVTTMLRFFSSVWIKQRIVWWFFYSGDIFYSHYILWVDEMNSVLLQDTPLWRWLLPVNTNCVPDYFQKTGVVEGL